MKKYFTLIFAFLFAVQVGHSQQDPMYTQYMWNTLAYNPAYAGSRDHMVFTGLYRTQWVNLDGAPSTEVFSIHTPLKTERIGLGLNVYHDKIGVNNQLGVFASYAYRIPLGKGKLALGLSGGVMNWRADLASLSQHEPNDPAFISDSNPNLWLPNFGFGIYYSTDLYYFGASIPHILDPDLRKEGIDPATQELFARQYRHFYLMGGFAIPLNSSLVFKPEFLIKNVGLFGEFTSRGNDVTAPTEFDITASFLINEVLWLGAGFRSAFEGAEDGTSYDSVDFLLGVYLKNGIRIGAAYDYTLTKLRTVSDGSFEVMLGYEFNFEKDKIVTPRRF
ncbi:MAG: type IX secretion system membrane protein PorP/SprF [Bacteroidota bacterium]